MKKIMDQKEFEALNCIAILGGTFNPVHKGHIMLAEEVIDQYQDIERLLVMPNNIPAYKEPNNVIDSSHRINMLKLAMNHIDKAYVSDMEIIRGGNTYTIDTLRQIKAYNKNIKIYFIIGADSLYNIEKWREFKEIFLMCTIVVAKRDCDIEDIIRLSQALMYKYPDASIKTLTTDAVDISSSQLRDSISKGLYDKEYLPESIINYIKTNKLYRMED